MDGWCHLRREWSERATLLFAFTFDTALFVDHQPAYFIGAALAKGKRAVTDGRHAAAAEV